MAATGLRIVVVDDGETHDGMVRDVSEVPTSRCADLSGRGGARNWAIRAGTALQQRTVAVE